MGVYSTMMIGSDDIGDYFDGVKDEFVKLSGIELDDEAMFSIPNEFPSYDNYDEIRAAFAKHSDELFGLHRYIVEDYVIYGVTTLYMAMGAPLPKELKDSAIYAAKNECIAGWKKPMERLSNLEEFMDAVNKYDDKTPLFEISSRKIDNYDNIIAVPWVTAN